MTSPAARRLFLALLLASAAPLFALDVPPKPTQWVNDYGANLLTAAETQDLNQDIEQMRARTGVPMLVMIWPSAEGEDARDFTLRVAKMWKVNDDRALMLFVFVEDRKTFIQVGRGLKSAVPDAFAADVYRNTIVPRFRQRQFYAGIVLAIGRMEEKLAPQPAPLMPPARITPAVQTPLPSRDTTSSALPEVVVLFVGLGALVFIALALAALWRRNGGRSGGGYGVAVWPVLDSTPPSTGFTDNSGPMFAPFISSSDAGSSSASASAGADVGGSWGGDAGSFDGSGAGGSW